MLRGLIDEHQIKQLSPKIKEDCSLSLTLKLVVAIVPAACDMGSLRAVESLLRLCSSRKALNNRGTRARGPLPGT